MATDDLGNWRALSECFRSVRARTEALCRPLTVEDCCTQPEAFVSPPKWHLAHTSWFFEEFLLRPFLPLLDASIPKDYRPFDPHFSFLFNSYYEAAGDREEGRAEKPRRAHYSRPPLGRVLEYRHYITENVMKLISAGEADGFPAPAGKAAADPAELPSRLELGIHHEEQHQELLLCDIKNILHFNPEKPALDPAAFLTPAPASSGEDWLEMEAGIHSIGHGGEGFAFDNEAGRHAVLLPAFRLRQGLVTTGEYLEFVRAGGYRDPKWWLADAWLTVKREGWQAPLYWEPVPGPADGSQPGRRGGEGSHPGRSGGDPSPSGEALSEWREYTLAGLSPLNPARPVSHLSYYEAEAYARWRGLRLPTEFEWEAAAASGRLRGTGLLWEWTSSAYLPYPGYRPWQGALGEYNGKFMVGQMVLRGGSVASPPGHVRPTYRNFFPPETRWQFAGLRLAA